MRKTPIVAVLVSLAIAASFTGCTGGAPSAKSPDNCTSPISPGAATDLIHVSGAFGEEPVVSIPTPLKASATQRKIVLPGQGPALVMGQLVDVDFTFIDGQTGQVEQSHGYGPGSVSSRIALNEQTLPGLVDGLLCSQLGSRIAIAVAPGDLVPGKKTTNSGGDTLVAVIDVVKAFPVRANGVPQAAEPGFPEVVSNDDGVTGVVIPDADAPKGLMITDTKKGNGAVVGESDNVVVQYTGVLWNQRTLFDSTWKNGSPATLPAGQSNGLIPGFSKALQGQTVGSQVLAVIPPDQGYGQRGVPQAGIPSNASLVFVIDILGIA